MNRVPGIRPLLATALLALAAAGCSNEDVADRGAALGRAAAIDRMVHAGVDTVAPASPDAAPGESQLPAPVRAALRRPLEAWTLSWRLALPALRLDQFERAAAVSFAAEEPTPYDGGFEGADLRLQHLVVPSPDVWLLVDPFLDLELHPTDDGGVRAVRVDEPGVAVLDLRARTERRVIDLPAGARVDGAHWLDERRVAVLVDEPARGGRRPVVYLVNLATEGAVPYRGPVAEPAEAAAARADLDRRFRAARPSVHLAAGDGGVRGG